MRATLWFVLSVMPITLVSTPAAEPFVPAQPTVMTASGIACGNAFTLHIRTVQFSPVTVDHVRQMPVSETVVQNGKVVERVRYLELRQQNIVMKSMPGPVIEVPVDGDEVSVVDLKGKPVEVTRLKTLLKKETPVLVSFHGDVDPFFLQTTKPGTLIVKMPASRLSAPAELLPPAKTDPNEPPLAKPSR